LKRKPRTSPETLACLREFARAGRPLPEAIPIHTDRATGGKAIWVRLPPPRRPSAMNVVRERSTARAVSLAARRGRFAYRGRCSRQP
jgi:hypothetical protein